MIFPLGINIFHYFAINNEEICMQECLNKKVLYQNDIYENTPLDYAIKKSAKNCVELLLNNSFFDKSIIESITQDDFCHLLKYSPNSIAAFVNNLTVDIQKDIPMSANLIKNPFFMLKNEIQIFKSKDSFKDALKVLE